MFQKEKRLLLIQSTRDIVVAIVCTIIEELAYFAGSNIGSLIGEDLDTAVNLGSVFAIVAMMVVIWIDHRQRGRHLLARVWSTYWRVWILFMLATMSFFFFLERAGDESIIFVLAFGLVLETVGLWIGLHWATRFYNRLEVSKGVAPETFL